MNTKKEIENLKNHMSNWFDKLGRPNAIVGVSGGKDSSVCLKIACDVLGKEHVLGVMMPNGVQHDIADSKKIIDFCGCRSRTVNIQDAYKGLTEAIGAEAADCYVYKTNTPARLRMTTLYGISAIEGGIVINTCNLSEDCVPGNYSTLFGDNAGSYSILQGFTVTEVLAIGDELGVPYELVHKTPSDGMCGSSDEENLARQTGINGFTYARFDKLLRLEKHDFTDEQVKILEKGYERGKFKNEIVHIPHYTPDLPNYFINRTR